MNDVSRVVLFLAGVLLFSGCTDNRVHWALDPIFLSPQDEGVDGTQTWQLYRKAWKNRFAQKHYLCSVVTQFRATPSATDCTECRVTFDVLPEIVDSDCEDSVSEDPTFVALRRVAVGPLAEGGPYPDASSIGYVDYGSGWEVHGWAYPEALANDQQAASFTWDNSEPFAFTPTGVWEFDTNSTGLTPPSQSSSSARVVLP